MFALLLVLFSTIPQDIVLSDSFEKVEVNHFYDTEGKQVFDQVIWYDWDYLLNQHKVEAWRIMKTPGYFPVLNRQNGYYESLFIHDDNIHRVKAKYLIETWTQFDPELVDRETYKKELRLDLQSRKKKVKTVDGQGLLFRLMGVFINVK